MPQEHDYTYEFAEGIRLRARFMLDRGIVVQFMVQLEASYESDWRQVVRYDNAHGQPHLDIFDRSGRQTSKHWLHQTNDEALTAAIDDIRANWPSYVDRFLREG